MSDDRDLEKAALLGHASYLTISQPEDGSSASDPDSSFATAELNLVAARTAHIEAHRAWNVAYLQTRRGRLTSLAVRGVAISIASIATLFLLLCLWLILTDVDPPPSAPYHRPSNPWKAAGKVPLEAHIMSKCPDARDCLRDLILPAMIQTSNDVDFTLSFIGRPTHDDDGVECMHGPGECLGNILELCAAELYPDPKSYLGFTMCMTKDYADVPKRELVEECALEHGLSFEKLNACASDDGGKGIGLLKSSVERTMEANVTKSCTVRVDEEVWCVRDGGKWKDCPGGSSVGNLVDEIRRLAG